MCEPSREWTKFGGKAVLCRLTIIYNHKQRNSVLYKRETRRCSQLFHILTIQFHKRNINRGENLISFSLQCQCLKWSFNLHKIQHDTLAIKWTTVVQSSRWCKLLSISKFRKCLRKLQDAFLTACKAVQQGVQEESSTSLLDSLKLWSVHIQIHSIINSGRIL